MGLKVERMEGMDTNAYQEQNDKGKTGKNKDA